MGAAFLGSIVVFVICLLITAAILRWFFRINDIIKRLDTIINLLEPKQPVASTSKPPDIYIQKPHAAAGQNPS